MPPSMGTEVEEWCPFAVVFVERLGLFDDRFDFPQRASRRRGCGGLAAHVVVEAGALRVPPFCFICICMVMVNDRGEQTR